MLGDLVQSAQLGARPIIGGISISRRRRPLKLTRLIRFTLHTTKRWATPGGIHKQHLLRHGEEVLATAA